MLFNSFIFILILLPVTLAGYFILNSHKRYKLAKVFVIIMSLWFYAYYEWKCLLFVVASGLINYLLHRLIIKGDKFKIPMILGLIVNIGSLAFFKYAPLNIIVPLAISFISFQQISFLLDTKNGRVGKTEFIDYCFYVMFFPKLISGPIALAGDFIPQTIRADKKQVDWNNIYKGIWMFALGLAKKVLLADVLAKAVDFGFSMYMYVDGFSTFVAIILYSFQLYFDFSGYCDMARGIGCMFNIDIPVNFLSPYKATDINDFWDRWHITLTKFFTKYLYIPLGGSRHGNARTYINILVVFLISGLWHGEGFTFIIWGLLHGIGSIVSRTIKRTNKEIGGIRKAIRVFLTFLYVSFAWLFFRADSVNHAIDMTKHIFKGGFALVCREMTDFFVPVTVNHAVNYLHVNGAVISILFFVIYFLISVYLSFFSRNIYEMEDKIVPTKLKTIALAVIVAVCMLNISGVSKFLYFNF